jgi:hypothetical protein
MARFRFLFHVLPPFMGIDKISFLSFVSQEDFTAALKIKREKRTGRQTTPSGGRDHRSQSSSMAFGRRKQVGLQWEEK